MIFLKEMSNTPNERRWRIGIAGQPIPEKLDEYNTETEIVEETNTTNLKNVNRGESNTTETLAETTTINYRRNLDKMGRKVMVESSQTTTTKGGITSNNNNMGRKVIVESSQTTITTKNRFARGNNDNMGRKIIVESSQTTITKCGRNNSNDNMGRKVIVQTSETTTTVTGNRFGKGNNDNMGRQVIVETSQK